MNSVKPLLYGNVTVQLYSRLITLQIHIIFDIGSNHSILLTVVNSTN